MKVYFHFSLFLLTLTCLSACSPSAEKVEFSLQSWTWMSISTGSISLREWQDIAYINQFSGSVILDDTIANTGALIYSESVLITGSGSEVEIIFADHSLIRLMEHSRLEISKKWTDNTALALSNWSIWTRILKPFTDISFFTLETDDLSAGVRGTSVWMRVTPEWTEIWVVDSTSTGWQQSGIDIEFKNNTRALASKLRLWKEELLKVTRLGRDQKKLNLAQFLELYPVVGVNTLRDIRYMHTIMQKWDPKNMTDYARISKELEVTMPSKDEALLFLVDPTIRSSIESRKGESLSLEQFLYYLDIEERIEAIQDGTQTDSDKTRQIQEVRKSLSTLPTSIFVPVQPPIPTVQTQKKIAPVITTKTQSTVSGETSVRTQISPCVPRVSWEPCR